MGVRGIFNSIHVLITSNSKRTTIAIVNELRCCCYNTDSIVCNIVYHPIFTRVRKALSKGPVHYIYKRAPTHRKSALGFRQSNSIITHLSTAALANPV